MDGNTPHEQEMSQVCLLLEAMEETIAEGMWVAHFDTLPPKTQLVVTSNRQFLELDLKELPKKLKYTFLGDQKTYLIIILSTLDD